MVNQQHEGERAGTGVGGPEGALARLGLVLPVAPNPVAAYVPVKRCGDVLFVSGQIPMRAGAAVAKGIVPTQVPLALARECAVQCTLNALAAVKAFLEGEEGKTANLQISKAANEGGGKGEGRDEGTEGGNERRGLARVRQVVRVGCFVACTPEFTDHPQVANAASELLIAVFGDCGRHARAAVGAPGLPLGVPVEIEFVFEAGRV